MSRSYRLSGVSRLLAVVLAVVASVTLSAGGAQAKAKPKPRASTAAPAKAPACYTPAEYDADQALRLHTELMVVGLKCQEVYRDQDPFGVYTEFTKRHHSQLAAFEQQMMGYFRRTGIGNPTQRFDSFRTGLANEVSRRAAIIGNTDYCELMVPLVVQTRSMSDPEVQHLVGDASLMRLAHRPLCGQEAKGAPPPQHPITKAATAAQKPAKPTKPTKVAKPGNPAKPKPKAAAQD